MTVREEVFATFRRVADANARRLEPLSDELRLTECGLDSLSFALIVTSLEESLHADPFSAADAAPFPVTIGEFVRCYERAIGRR